MTKGFYLSIYCGSYYSKVSHAFKETRVYEKRRRKIIRTSRKSTCVAFCGLLIIQAILTTDDSRAQTAADLGQGADRIFKDWTDSDSPGVAVAVVRSGRVVFSRGYGLANLEYHVAVTPATPFDIGSITKQFTAFAVAALAEQGKLFLNDDVRKYIPEMKVRGGPVQIRHLLDHTSGLRDEFNLMTMEGYGIEDAVTFEHSLRLITNQEELNFEPGSRWEYSNSGYTLLAEVVSRVTGKPFSTWMRENIFVPLGMTGTGFPESAGTIIKNRAYSYTEGPDGWHTAVVGRVSLGCSNLFMTVEDLAKWAINFDEPKVGGRSVIDRMSKGGILNDGTETNYGFGQFVGKYRGLRTFYHDGGIGGYRSALFRFPDQGFAVAVLANADHIPAMKLAKETADLFIGDIMPEPKEKAGPSPGERIAAGPPVELKDCVGSYQLDTTGKVLEVALQDARLVLKNLATRGQLLPLSRSQGNEFTVGGVGMKMTFVKNDKGIVNRLILHVGNPPQVAMRIATMTMTEAELARYVGIYVSTELLTAYSFEIRNGKLLANHSRWPPVALTPIGPSEFTSDKMWIRPIRFELDKNGNPVGLHADAAYAKNVYFEKLK